MSAVEVGSVWWIRGCDFVLAEKRRIQRGRREGGLELRFMPMVKHPKWIGFRGIMMGSAIPNWMGPASRSYTKDEIAKALGTGEQAYRERDEKREEYRQERVEALDFSKVVEGDEVLVGYRDGQKWEKVAAINYATGKFGIKRPGYVKKDFDAVDYLLFKERGINRVHPDRKYRWLPATIIKEVRKATKS